MMSIFENGIYQAVLYPINKPHTGPISSSLTIVKMDDELRFHVRSSGLAPDTMHLQNIHVGFRCPDVSDDINQDGLIDTEEGGKIYKHILIPLDDELNSQRVGSGIFPISNYFGQYFWSRATSTKNLLNDLYDLDINKADEIIKLNPDEPFHLKDKLIVISTKQDDQQDIPIACGVIQKLIHTPGRIDNDETDIPLPDEEYNKKLSEREDGANFERPYTPDF